MLVLTGSLLVLLLILLAAQYVKLQLSRARFPPGPTPLPIIGNLAALGFEVRHERLMQLAKTYGNIFTVWFGHTPVIVLNGCQAIRDALISHSEVFSGRPQIPIFEKISRGKGVIMSTGHTWKQQRRFGIVALRNLGLGKKVLERRIQEEAQYLTEQFAALKGKAAEPRQKIVHAVTNVISAVTFGHRFSSEDKVFHHLIECMDYMATFIVSTWARIYDAFPSLVEHLPGNFLKRCNDSNYFLENYAKQEIDIHRENGVLEEPIDVIDFYLAKISTVTTSPPPPVLHYLEMHHSQNSFACQTTTSSRSMIQHKKSRWLLIQSDSPNTEERYPKQAYFSSILLSLPAQSQDHPIQPTHLNKISLLHYSTFTNLTAISVTAKALNHNYKASQIPPIPFFTL